MKRVMLKAPLDEVTLGGRPVKNGTRGTVERPDATKSWLVQFAGRGDVVDVPVAWLKVI